MVRWTSRSPDLSLSNRYGERERRNSCFCFTFELKVGVTAASDSSERKDMIRSMSLVWRWPYLCADGVEFVIEDDGWSLLLG